MRSTRPGEGEGSGENDAQESSAKLNLQSNGGFEWFLLSRNIIKLDGGIWHKSENNLRIIQHGNVFRKKQLAYCSHVQSFCVTGTRSATAYDPEAMQKNKTFHITFSTGLARRPTIWHDAQPNNRDVGASRKPIGEVGCCEPRMAERIHWWTERWLELCFLEWLTSAQLLGVVWCSAVVAVA